MTTQKQLKEQLCYDENTGLFTWLISNSNRVKVGDIAGCLCKSSGYMLIGVNGKLYRAHRLAWLYIYGEFPKYQIDHVNHIRTDNRIINLRAVTHQENQRNRSKSSRNTSNIVGVYWNKPKNKWYAQIKVSGKNKHLGYFSDKFDAISARKSANNKYGYHQNHGK